MGFSGKVKASNVDFGALLNIEDKVMDEKKITEGEESWEQTLGNFEFQWLAEKGEPANET